MDKTEEQIMKYAEKVNDWFTPREAFKAIYPEKTYIFTNWESNKFSKKHRSLTKYGFLETAIFHPNGTGFAKWHYRIKRD